MEQAPLRRGWKIVPNAGKKAGHGDPMDVDLAEKSEEQQQRESWGMDCQPCTDELNTMKGGGKGADGNQPFQGYCNYCWIRGHRRAECRKLTADLAQKGKSKGEAKGKGKGK